MAGPLSGALVLGAVLSGAVVLAASCVPRDPDSFAVSRPSSSEAQPEVEPLRPAAGDWPWWRGPGRDGKAAPDADPPLEWGTERNVVWSVDVPGRGHGSPSVVGDRIFLATAEEEAERQLLLAYDRETGDELWRTAVHEGGFVHRHYKNSHASGTPASDGDRVYIAFLNADAIQVTALDPADGSEVWRTKAGDFETQHGYGASPVLYGDLVIVAGDNQGGSWIAGLHRATGSVQWKTGRAAEPSYATPIAGRVAGRDQLLLHGTGVTTSYDPASGELLWWCEGPAETTASTMAFGGERVVASGGFPDEEILVVRADGSGNVTDTHVAWRTGQGVSYVPSPLVHDGRLWIVNDGGFLNGWRLEDGEKVARIRLGEPFSASPVLAGRHIFVTSERGATHVVRLGDAPEVVARNELGEGGLASPVIAGDRLYLRTLERLWCFGG